MNLAMDNLKSDYLIFMNSGDSFYDLNSLNLLFNAMKLLSVMFALVNH